MTTILIVDDDVDITDMYEDVIRLQRPDHPFVFLKAYTADDAMRLYHENRDVIDIVVLDGFLSFPTDENVTAEPVAQEIFSTEFSGVAIAASSDQRMRRRLVEIGCQHEVAQKREVPVLVASLVK